MEHMKSYIAEFIGTCVLVLMACGVAVVLGCNTAAGYVGTALAFGLVIVAMAYSIGNISGCHINPAVSLAMLMTKKMSVRDFVGYIIAQVAGALTGSLLLALFVGGFESLGGNVAQPILVYAYGDVGAQFVALIVEVVLTFIFVTAILGVTSKTENKAVTGLVIGGALTLVHLLGIGLTGTSVNPARSLAPALFQSFTGATDALAQIWVFIIGPMAGAALAAIVFNLFSKKSAPAQTSEQTSESEPESKEENA